MTEHLGNSGELRARGAPPQVPHIAGYTVIEYLGTGPSGQTWHARTRAGRPVALKLLSARLVVQPGFLTRFEKETAPALALSHPHIVALVERGRSASQFYIATEYIPGGSVRKLLRQQLEPHVALRLALDVAKALYHTHMRGVLHRGLKPENILLTPSGAAKVADFGLARLRGDESTSLSHYTAPEQRTRPAYADGRADLYALATLLYELLYGDRPPRPWSAAASKVPVRDTRLFSLFSQSLAEDPDLRFQRLRDFSDELERLLESRTEASAPAPAPLPPASSGPSLLELKGHTVQVRLKTRGDAEWLKLSLLALEQVLRQPGPWAVAYDLSEVSGWSTREVEVLVEIHRRYERNLRKVAFCSRFPSVRGGGVLVGTHLKQLPWKTFSALQPMLEWVEGRSVQ